MITRGNTEKNEAGLSKENGASSGREMHLIKLKCRKQ
jgi:hypothetical protein